MVRIVRLKGGDLASADGGAVIPADEVVLRLDAEALLEDARAGAESIARQAAEAYESEKARGYAEGLREADRIASERMLTLVDRSIDYLASIEREVVETVRLCVEKILGEVPEEELLVLTVRKALGLLVNEPQVTLIVRPEMRDAMQARIAEILKGHGGIGALTVASDERMGRGDCRVETEIGVVDASIEEQLAALETAMLARIDERGAKS